MDFPSRDEVENRLAALVEGGLSPEKAADWARPYVVDESLHPDQIDWPVWDALKQLLGADLLERPGRYLHEQRDYSDWLLNFRRATGS